MAHTVRPLGGSIRLGAMSVSIRTRPRLRSIQPCAQPRLVYQFECSHLSPTRQQNLYDNLIKTW